MTQATTQQFPLSLVVRAAEPRRPYVCCQGARIARAVIDRAGVGLFWLFSAIGSSFDAPTGVNLQQFGCIQQALVQGFCAVIAGDGQVQCIAGPQLGGKVLDVGFG